MAKVRRPAGQLSIFTIAVAVGAGCSFEPRGLDSDGPVASVDGALRDGGVIDAIEDGGAIDARTLVDAGLPDGRPDAPGCWPWLPTNIDSCSLPTSNGNVREAMAFTFDTDTGMTTFTDGTTATPRSALVPQVGAAPIRVVVYDDWLVEAPVKVVGSHPVVFVANARLVVDGLGSFDVSATMDAQGNSQAGPGGDDVLACATSTGGDGVASRRPNAGGGGGAGGAYGAGGGDGGVGSGTGSGTGGTGGAPSGAAGFSPLRGGCAGGAGGDLITSGQGGAGGGALQLVARVEIVLTDGAFVRASGAGGQGAAVRGGGGGAGSGGAILLEAGALTLRRNNGLMPAVCANGGSGGEGGGGVLNRSASGQPGTCDPATGASTKGVSAEGGDGGDGGFAARPPGVAGQPASPGSNEVGFGGGGGGAGVGRVRLRSALIPADIIGLTVTPAAE